MSACNSSSNSGEATTPKEVPSPATINGIKQMGDGKLVGLPVENSALVVYYNKDIFDKFGVTYPKDGMNWDEFNDLARKLNVEWQGNVYAGFALSAHTWRICRWRKKLQCPA